MGVRSLGYWGFEVSDPQAWTTFLVDQLGMVEGDRGADGSHAFRLDAYASRIRLHQGPSDDIAYIGWEVSSARDLNDQASKLEAAGYAITQGSGELAQLRQVEDLIVVYDPDGVRTEIFWGPRFSPKPFASPIVPKGFVAAPNGPGHHVLVVQDCDKTNHFYCDLLGLRLSDYIKSVEPDRPELVVTFLHANARHHSFAFAEVPFTPKRKMQHFAVQVADMSDVGLAYDRCLAAGHPVAMTLGHHPNCLSFSFYVRTPSGIDLEYTWGSREVDDTTWMPKAYSQLSDWGHQVKLDLIEPA